MINFRSQSKQLTYFVFPFLFISGIIFWNHLRIAGPDCALKTAREYLEEQFPGAQWELGKMTMVGEGLGKKWRLELSSSQKDGRRIQANLLVGRWRPGKIVGRFILLLSPPQILDGGWNQPTFLEWVSAKVSRATFFLFGILFLIFQVLWLYRVCLRGEFHKLDGVVLVLSGGALLLIFMAMEVHSGFMIVYPLIFTCLGFVALSKERKGIV